MYPVILGDIRWPKFFSLKVHLFFQNPDYFNVYIPTQCLCLNALRIRDQWETIILGWWCWTGVVTDTGQPKTPQLALGFVSSIKTVASFPNETLYGSLFIKMIQVLKTQTLRTAIKLNYMFFIFSNSPIIVIIHYKMSICMLYACYVIYHVFSYGNIWISTHRVKSCCNLFCNSFASFQK